MQKARPNSRLHAAEVWRGKVMKIQLANAARSEEREYINKNDELRPPNLSAERAIELVEKLDVDAWLIPKYGDFKPLAKHIVKFGERAK